MAVIPAPPSSGGGGGGGVATQGARDATVQPWYIDNAPGDTLLVEDEFLRELRDDRTMPLDVLSTTVVSGTPATLLTPAAGMSIEVWKFGWTPRRTSTDTGNICTLRWADAGFGVENIWQAVASQITHVLLGDANRPLEFDPANAEEVAVNVWFREV